MNFVSIHECAPPLGMDELSRRPAEALCYVQTGFGSDRTKVNYAETTRVHELIENALRLHRGINMSNTTSSSDPVLSATSLDISLSYGISGSSTPCGLHAGGGMERGIIL